MACSAPPVDVPIKGPPVFRAPPPAGGPALFVRGALEGDRLQVEVFGKELGSIIGYAFRIALDGLKTQPDEPAIIDEALGPHTSGEVLYLGKTTSSSLLFGGARLGSKAQERAIDGETRLAHFTLRVPAATGQLTLVDTSVRRLSGDGVVISVSGGSIGAAP
ncbi:MAG: hypothetical protein K1X64_17190 [Myxococcaceae bacterium]|nr:hypothetical protein [Myxococcaceae bacterium]